MDGEAMLEAPPAARPASAGRWLYRIFYEWPLVKGSWLLFSVAGVILVFQVLTVVVDASFRRSPWPSPFRGGALELEELQMGLLSAMTIGFTWFLGGHIRIELLRDRMKPRIGAIADTIAGICGVLYAGGVFWGLVTATGNTLKLDAHTDMLELPIGPFQVFFTLAFLQFTLILVAFTVKSIYRIVRPPAEPHGWGY